MTTALVVGSGPNGLAGAVRLARAGVDVTVLEAADTIGGGTRTAELTVPGVLHDVCSAVHPLGAASPFFASLDLHEHGLVWDFPEIDLAHPLDGGRAGALHRSMDVTTGLLGADGASWERTFGPIAARFADILEEILVPPAHLPRHPGALARFGVLAADSALHLARRWGTDEAQALFTGVAAHLTRPLTGPASAAVGVVLTGALHAAGWPVARGGSRAITDALAADLLAHGGRIETGRRVTAWGEFDGYDTVLLDLSPRGVADLEGSALPGHVARAYRRYRYGPASFKLDLAVDGGVPWTNEVCGRAGTVHLGGTAREIADAERDVNAGRMPERPFVLLAQQYLADPTRSAGDVHPVWAYAHVPHGWTGDATQAILDQIERFAPGTRERIVGTAVTGPAEWEAYNANYVGGDIANGANTIRQLAARPRPALDPYATGVPGVYLCSAATTPGGGVHGMCGANAAASALRRLAR